MPETVLVVAAHPDDEVLGPGGTAARHALMGDEVRSVIVAEGATSRGDGAGAVERLREAARRASAVLGAGEPVMLGLPDNRLDGVPLLDVVQALEKVFDELRPTTVYTHHAGDLNVDHQVVARAVVTACRPLPGQRTTRVLAFETVSSTEWMTPTPACAFQPRLFVDVTRTMERKLCALREYASEMRPSPHARSMETVEALARWRGASAGLAYAEAFDVVRIVERDQGELP